MPWNDPPVFLPMEGKARYYWIWPHPAGTLVGTTEREVSECPRDPMPTRDEIVEILNRLKRDVPHAGLNEDKLHYAYAGVRTLALEKGKDVSQVSRSHRWEYSNGVLSLIGGKFTTASFTALDGLRKIVKLSGAKRELISLRGRKLPGSGIESGVQLFREAALKESVPASIVASTIRRFGSRASRILRFEKGLTIINNSVLSGEIDLVIEEEQAERIEDILRRRLELEYQPFHGLETLDAVGDIMSKRSGGRDFTYEKKLYCDRISHIDELLRRSLSL